MIEIRDTFRGGKDADIESRGKCMGRVYPLPLWLGVRRSILSSPNVVQGRAPAKNGFCAFWAQENASLTGKNVKMITAFWWTAWTAGTHKMQSAKMRKRTTYKMQTKMRSCPRILYVTTYKLLNKKMRNSNIWRRLTSHTNTCVVITQNVWKSLVMQ